MKTITHYASTQEGIQLLKSHSLDESGVWSLLASEDFGGHRKHLAYVSGTLKDVIDHALTLPNFGCSDYGSGMIQRIVVTPIDPEKNSNRRRLLAEYEATKERLAEIKNELDQ